MPISGLSPWESQMKGPPWRGRGTDVTIPIREVRKVPSRSHALPPDRTYCLAWARIHFLRWILSAFRQAHHFTPTPADADFFTHGSFPGLSQPLSPSSPPLPSTQFAQQWIPSYSCLSRSPACVHFFLCSLGSTINTPTCALSLPLTHMCLLVHSWPVAPSDDVHTCSLILKCMSKALPLCY